MLLKPTLNKQSGGGANGATANSGNISNILYRKNTVKKPTVQASLRRKFTFSLNNATTSLLLNGQYANELKQQASSSANQKSTTRNSGILKTVSTLSSIERDESTNSDLVFDPIDANLVYSVSSLIRHYVFRESVSVNDPYEGFLDLSCVKHLRHGCLDSQVMSQLQQIAFSRYGMANFDQTNVVCLVYGTTLAENRSLYMIGMRQSIGLFYKVGSFFLLFHFGYLLLQYKKNNLLFLQINFTLLEK